MLDGRRGSAGAGGTTITRLTRTAPSAKQAASVANGIASPIANRAAPIGGTTSWLVSRIAPWMPGVRDAEVLAARRGSGRRLLAESANVSAVPSTNRASRTIGDADAARAIVAARSPRITARTTFDPGHDPAPVAPVRDDPAVRPNRSGGRSALSSGQRDEERVPRERGDQQGPGGERDAVADVRDRRGGQEPAETAPQAGWCDGLDGARERGRHAPRGYPARQRRRTVPTWRVTMPPVRPRQRDVDEAGLAHDLRDPLRRRVGLDAAHEVARRRCPAPRPGR